MKGIKKINKENEYYTCIRNRGGIIKTTKRDSTT